MELIKRFRIGNYVNNCYLIKENNKIILIDAPAPVERILKYLEKNEMILDEIWLTHSHFDHIAGIEELQKKFPNLKIYCPPGEISFLNDPQKNFSPKEDIVKFPGKVASSKELEKLYSNLKFAYIQGHSFEGVVYIFENENVMFTGDILFLKTIGRADLEFGNKEKLIEGIQEKLFSYADECKVYPGHGFSTTIGAEKKYNEFVKI